MLAKQICMTSLKDTCLLVIAYLLSLETKTTQVFFKMITIHTHQPPRLQTLDRAHIPRTFANRAPDADILIPKSHKRPFDRDFGQRLVVREDGHYGCTSVTGEDTEL